MRNIDYYSMNFLNATHIKIGNKFLPYNNISNYFKFVSIKEFLNKKKYFVKLNLLKSLECLIYEDMKKCFIQIGTKGPYQNLIIICKKNKYYFYKIALGSKAIETLENEKNILIYLKNKLNKSNIPALEFFDNNCLITSYLNLNFRKVTYKHIKWWLEFQERDHSYILLKDSSTWKNVMHYYKKIIKKKDFDKMLYELNILKDSLEMNNIFIKEVFTHRDFTKWNIKGLENHQLYLYDFEYSKIKYIEFYDLFHFYFFPLALRKELNETKLYEILAFLKNKFSIKKDIKINVLLYLADVILFYIYSNMGLKKYDDCIINLYFKLFKKVLKWKKI